MSGAPNSPPTSGGLPNSSRQVARILRVATRQRLDLLIPLEQIRQPLVRWLLQGIRALLPTPTAERGERLRDAFLDLGPVYIKLGQLLSTRRDLLPMDIADALASLQDRVPPIPDFDVRQFVEARLEGDLTHEFLEVDPAPMASASIAQVHAARLNNGHEVVVKIVRPGVATAIRRDMVHIKALAQVIPRYVPDAKRLHLSQIASDQERVLEDELNMFHEARNQIQLRRNFAESPLLYVPRVYDHLTREDMLVMERVHGVPVGNIAALESQGVDLQVLAYKGVEAFFTQVFRHNFFHADMHPGNILVDTSTPEDPKYIALDCAIIGSLTAEDRDYLAHNLMAFFKQDYRAVVNLHMESGWIPPNTDLDEFEAVIRDVCDPIFAKPLAEISFADFIVQLFRTAGEFNMEVQPQLVLLQKTLLYIEGLGRQLYPELDLWQTAQPFMERWLAEQMAPANTLAQWLSDGPDTWRRLLRLPRTITQNQVQLRALKGDMHQVHETLERVERHLSRHDRSKRFKQVAGVGLVAVAAGLLWQPIAQSLGSGDVSMLAGVVGAFLGSALLIRA